MLVPWLSKLGGVDDVLVQLKDTERRRFRVNAVCIAGAQLLSFPLAAALASTSQWWWFFLLLWVVSSSSLYTRFTHPVRSTVLVVLGMLITIAAPLPFAALWWAVPVVVYHWARYGSRGVRTLTLVAGIVSSLAGGSVFLKFFTGYGWPPIELAAMYTFATLMCLAVVVIAWFFADSRRLRENRHRALIERNRQLVHEREQERVMAALDERARIAREMHDIVAHSLSTIIAQADGARYAAMAAQAARASAPDAPTVKLTGNATGQQPVEPVEVTALSTISQAARSSLQQMRALLGVLRTDEGQTFEPLPALHNVPQLIESVQNMGTPIKFSMVHGVEQRLPQGAELTVYRIVQEALTNITKHCPNTPLATVNISASKKTLDIDIVNLPQQIASAPIPGAHRGLLGMRERIDMYNGTLHYGLLEDGSFRVFAQIPFTP